MAATCVVVKADIWLDDKASICEVFKFLTCKVVKAAIWSVFKLLTCALVRPVSPAVLSAATWSAPKVTKSAESIAPTCDDDKACRAVVLKLDTWSEVSHFISLDVRALTAVVVNAAIWSVDSEVKCALSMPAIAAVEMPLIWSKLKVLIKVESMALNCAALNAPNCWVVKAWS